MSDKKNPQIIRPNHGIPVTRREMLAQGMISFGAYLAMPSVLSIFSRQAYGQEILDCSGGGSSTRMVPLIIFDLAGGANIAGTNVIVGGQGGQHDYLTSGYGTIGLAPEVTPDKFSPTELSYTEFGLAFHPNSRMLAGMRQTTTEATRAGVDGALFCTSSGDDTRNNPHNPLYWIAKAGLRGELVSLVGTSDSPSGGRAVAPAASIDPSKQPSRITRPEDALGLVNAGRLAQLIEGISNRRDALDDVKKVLNASKTMSESRLRTFQEKDLPSQISELIRCGYINSSEFMSRFSAEEIDPRQDAAVTARFPGIANNQNEQRAATIAKLVLDGYAGAGVIELGGYDYHGQGRARQDSQDLLAGQMIGRVLELAAAKEQPVMIYVYTDGGVSSGQAGANGNGFFAFSSDSGQRSASFALVYKPGGGRVEMRSEGRQIGAYKNGGTVDGTVNAISGSVVNLTKAIVANYLALHDKVGDLEKVVGDNPFGKDLENYLAFGKLI